MTPLFRIRLAKIGDERSIARVHVVSWRTTYAGLISQEVLNSLSVEKRAGNWKVFIQSADENPENKILLVCENKNGKIVGFLAGGEDREEDSNFDSELYALYIEKDFQSHGIGRSLFKKFVNWLVQNRYSKMRVWVFHSNPYRKFYERMGGKLLPQTKMMKIEEHEYLDVSYGFSGVLNSD